MFRLIMNSLFSAVICILCLISQRSFAVSGEGGEPLYASGGTVGVAKIVSVYEIRDSNGVATLFVKTTRADYSRLESVAKAEGGRAFTVELESLGLQVSISKWFPRDEDACIKSGWMRGRVIGTRTRVFVMSADF